MKRVYYIFICLLWLSVSVLGQSINIKNSTTATESLFARIDKVYKSGDHIIVLQSEDLFSKKMTVKVYQEDNLKLISTHTIKEKNGSGKNCIGKEFSYVTAMVLKNQTFLFFQSIEKNTGILWLFAQKLNDQGELDGALIKIDKISGSKKSDPGSFGIEMSADSTKFMVISMPAFKKYNGEKFGFKVYDAKLNNLTNLALPLPQKNKEPKVKNYYLGNNGKIYLMSEIETSKYNNTHAVIEFSVFKVDPADQSIKEIKIELPQKTLYTSDLRLDDAGGKILVSGCFDVENSKNDVIEKCDGLYFVSIDMNSGETITSFDRVFDEKLTKELFGPKSAQSPGIYYSLRVKNIIQRKNGDYTVIAEMRVDLTYVKKTVFGDAEPDEFSPREFNRLDWVIFNINDKGQMTFITDIPKEQKSRNDYGELLSSLIIKTDDDRLILLYNDDPKNLDPTAKTKEDIYRLPSFTKTVLVACEIDKDGTYLKSKVQDNKKAESIIEPENGVKIRKGEYIVPIQNPQYFSFARKKDMGLARIIIN